MTGDPDPAAYLLGELTPDEHAEAKRRLAEDPAFAREVDRLRPIVLGLEALPGEAWDPPAPPPLRLPAEEPPGLLARVREAFAVPGFRVASAAVAIVAALAIGFGIGRLSEGGDGGGASTERSIALAGLPEAPGAGGTADVIDVAGGEELAVEVHDLPPTGTDEVYELWLLNSPEDLRSLGTFRVPASGAASVRVPLPVPPERFALVDVSRETLGGDPGHSGRSVLRAET